MYKARFVSDTGKEYSFDPLVSTVFDIDGLSGIEVNLGTSQGYAQVGETVQSQSLGGKALSISGVIHRDVQNNKKLMSRVFAPFNSGRLIVNEKFYIYVYIRTSPTFSPIKDDGHFSIMLFAPFPFFRAVEDTNQLIGEIIKGFSFPVNYGTPHHFGLRSENQFANVINNGDVSTSFKLVLAAMDYVENPAIWNVGTSERIDIDGTLDPGDIVEIYRADDGILRVEKTDINGVKTDAFPLLAESSNLFYLNVGDNVIMADADDGYEFLTVSIVYNPAFGGIADGF